MGIEDFMKRTCNQTAVYWGDPVDDGYGGETFGSRYPVEIDCRWEDVKEVIQDAQGNEIVSRSRIYVLEDVDEEGYLYLGTLDDLDSDELENPKKLNGAFKIKRFDKIPSIRGSNEFVRKAYI